MLRKLDEKFEIHEIDFTTKRTITYIADAMMMAAPMSDSVEGIVSKNMYSRIPANKSCTYCPIDPRAAVSR